MTRIDVSGIGSEDTAKQVWLAVRSTKRPLSNEVIEQALRLATLEPVATVQAQ